MKRQARKRSGRRKRAQGLAKAGGGQPRPDIPHTINLRDGRTVFVNVPGPWTIQDRGGELAFLPPAIRLLDRVRALAMQMPTAPTPGFILTLREALGLSQAALAARLGVDKMTVARWEWGRVSPSPAAIKALDKLRRTATRRGVVLAA